MAIVVPGLFLTSWVVTQKFVSLPWSLLIGVALVVCAISYVAVERWRVKSPLVPLEPPAFTPMRHPRSNLILDAVAKVDSVFNAQAEIEAATDDSDFPPERTGEQIFGQNYHAEKLTDGTWGIYGNGATLPIAKMSHIPGGWSVIHAQAGYIGKFRTELQVFEALDQQHYL